jgi:hypothetical protein
MLHNKITFSNKSPNNTYRIPVQKKAQLVSPFLWLPMAISS